MAIRANGLTEVIDVVEFTEYPYEVRVGVWVGYDDEDNGPLQKQVVVEAVTDDGSTELLLSIGEARALRDRLTEAIVVADATTAPPHKATKAAL